MRPKTERSGLFFLAGPSTVFFFLYFNEAIRCAVVVGPNFIWRVVYLFRMSGHLKSRPLVFYSADKMSSLIQILAPINSRRDIFPQRKNNWIKLKLDFLVLKIDQRIVGHFGSRTPYFFIGGMDCGHVLRTERCHDLAAMASKKKKRNKWTPKWRNLFRDGSGVVNQGWAMATYTEMIWD